MPEPRYEKLSAPSQPEEDEVAILFYDDCNPVRSHYVCYRTGGYGGKGPYYAVAHMASEDTNYSLYHGPAPHDRGLDPYSIYRVHGSDKLNGFDREHIVLCLSDKTIELAGMSFAVSDPVEGKSAVAVLLDHVRRREVDTPTA
jgi:hypothetical protein